jgi:hypothetical protein
MKKFLLTTLVVTFAIFGFQGVSSTSIAEDGSKVQELPYQH